MTAWILEFAEKKPSFAIGVGQAFNLGQTGRYVSDSDLMVVEADEYANDPLVDHTPRFMFQTPKVIVCTNLEFDHPDIYKSFDDVKLAYLKFFKKLSKDGTLVINGENDALKKIADAMKNDIHVIEVSQHKDSTFQSGVYRAEKGKTSLELTHASKTYVLELKVPGKFNAMNALYAVAAASAVGVSIETSLKAMREFTSTMRRFENMGEKHGVQFYDDYAHHPTEIEATLAALREWYPKSKVYALFQSHTFSRTKALLNEFAHAFEKADEVLLIEIFPSAREAYDPTINSDLLAEKITETGKLAKNLHDIEGIRAYLKQKLQPGDVVITLGAGDLYHLHEVM
jgi:UDP-N-acetylmuramate--alanine ligase